MRDGVGEVQIDFAQDACVYAKSLLLVHDLLFMCLQGLFFSQSFSDSRV